MRLGSAPLFDDDDARPEVFVYAQHGCIGPILRGVLRGFTVAPVQLHSAATVEIVTTHGHVSVLFARVMLGNEVAVNPSIQIIAEHDDRLFWRLSDWRERRARGEAVTVQMRLEQPPEDPLVAVARRALNDSNPDRYTEAMRRLMAREDPS